MDILILVIVGLVAFYYSGQKISEHIIEEFDFDPCPFSFVFMLGNFLLVVVYLWAGYGGYMLYTGTGMEEMTVSEAESFTFGVGFATIVSLVLTGGILKTYRDKIDLDGNRMSWGWAAGCWYLHVACGLITTVMIVSIIGILAILLGGSPTRGRS